MVDAQTVRTFEEFTRKSAGRWSQHDRIGAKPLLQWGGPGLDEISFTVRLDATLGINPRRESDNLTLMAGGGKAYSLVLGGKPMGVGLWAVTSVELSFPAIDNHGNVLVAIAAISLKEYVVK
ncbi:phage tail protein [Paenibacillus xanthanilyticus]